MRSMAEFGGNAGRRRGWCRREPLGVETALDWSLKRPVRRDVWVSMLAAPESR